MSQTTHCVTHTAHNWSLGVRRESSDMYHGIQLLQSLLQLHAETDSCMINDNTIINRGNNCGTSSGSSLLRLRLEHQLQCGSVQQHNDYSNYSSSN